MPVSESFEHLIDYYFFLAMCIHAFISSNLSISSSYIYAAVYLMLCNVGFESFNVCRYVAAQNVWLAQRCIVGFVHLQFLITLFLLDEILALFCKLGSSVQL